MNIIIYGQDELERKLKRIEGEIKTDADKVMSKAVLYVHGQVPAYPPPPTGSTYRRTGTLGRSITTEVRSLGDETIGLIGSNTIYSPWVISDRSVGSIGPQAWMHRGRWWTLQGVVLKARDAVEKIFNDWLKRLVES